MADDQTKSPTVASAATPPSKPATGTDTVTVACRIPNGIGFDLQAWETAYEPILGGGQREIRIARPTGERVTLRGPGPAVQAMRRGQEIDHVPVGGYALTQGVPREHWEKVEKDYADHPALVNHLVFAAKNDAAASDEARATRGVRTGLEGIDPDKPGLRTGIRSVERAQRAGEAA